MSVKRQNSASARAVARQRLMPCCQCLNLDRAVGGAELLIIRTMYTIRIGRPYAPRYLLPKQGCLCVNMGGSLSASLFSFFFLFFFFFFLALCFFSRIAHLCLGALEKDSAASGREGAYYRQSKSSLWSGCQIPWVFSLSQLSNTSLWRRSSFCRSARLRRTTSGYLRAPYSGKFLGDKCPREVALLQFTSS